MMLSGPSPGTERYKEAKLFISRVLDGASISPRSMESPAINRRAGREQGRVKNGGGGMQKSRENGKASTTTLQSILSASFMEVIHTIRKRRRR